MSETNPGRAPWPVAAIWVAGTLVILAFVAAAIGVPAALILGIVAVIPAMIAARKGHEPTAWWCYGTVLFVLALPHALLAKDRTRRPCPFCAERIRVEAKICPHCRNEVPPTADARVSFIAPSNDPNTPRPTIHRDLLR